MIIDPGIGRPGRDGVVDAGVGTMPVRRTDSPVETSPRVQAASSRGDEARTSRPEHHRSPTALAHPAAEGPRDRECGLVGQIAIGDPADVVLAEDVRVDQGASSPPRGRGLPGPGDRALLPQERTGAWRRSRRKASMNGFRSPSITAWTSPSLVAGAVVLDHGVGLEDVRADLVPPGDLGLRSSRCPSFFASCSRAPGPDAGAQDPHGEVAVAVLRAFGLGLHHDAGRQVGDAHGGVGLVDVLPARAAGPEGVDAEVLVLDLDVGRPRPPAGRRRRWRRRCGAAWPRRTARCGPGGGRRSPP